MPDTINKVLKILIVDDTPVITKLMAEQLQKNYGADIQCIEADSGADAIKKVESEAPVDAIIADLVMPGMNGLELLRSLNQKYPVMHKILLSGHADLENITNALNDCGVCAFIPKPWRVSQLFVIIDSVFSKVRLHRENIALNDANQKSFQEMLNIISAIVSELSPELAVHAASTARLCVKTATLLGLDAGAVLRVETAARLHCLGLLGMPRESLKVHPSQLAGDARMIYSAYPEVSAEMLKSTPRFQAERDIIRMQNENVDGSGPLKISGDEIPIEARILRICEFYDSAVKLRREDKQNTLTMMSRRIGQIFDKRCLNAFVKVIQSEIEVLVLPLSLDDLNPGMQIAKDVKSKSGRMVLSAGTVLNTINLKRLRIYSVTDPVNEVFVHV